MTALEVCEYDEAGNLVSTYIESVAGVDAKRGTRIDVIKPKDAKPLLQRLLDVFLPAGYPQSVTDDYLEYQIYDSLQAFSSSIAGLLSNRAVLEGVGVGNASTTPTAALLLTILQETTGRLATIFFAYRLGTSLEPECKMFRLSADIFNDCAMMLDCLNPALPSSLRIGAMCGAGVLRAMCGIAAGSSKASLSKHFARWGNLGELNAKDSSQETVISLLGTLTGTLVISHIQSPLAVWSALLVLLTIHISTNTLAVRSVRLRTLNRQRANLVFSHALSTSPVWHEDRDGVGFGHEEPLTIPTPAEISAQERIFCLPGSVLRHRSPTTGKIAVIGHAHIGVPLHDVLCHVSTVTQDKKTGAFASSVPATATLNDLVQLFAQEQYLLWYDSRRRASLIVLKRGASVEAAVKAWFHGFLVAFEAATISDKRDRPAQKEVETPWKAADTQDLQRPLLPSAENGPAADLELLRMTLGRVRAGWPRYAKGLREAGWDLDEGALETRSGVRVQL